jgi:ethanolamine ammonia-lyase small subunit
MRRKQRRERETKKKKKVGEKCVRTSCQTDGLPEKPNCNLSSVAAHDLFKVLRRKTVAKLCAAQKGKLPLHSCTSHFAVNTIKTPPKKSQAPSLGFNMNLD